MSSDTALEAVFARHACEDFKWISPRDIVVAQWVRMKCTFGCSSYGNHATCPPNVPTVVDCRAFFDEYERGVLFRFTRAVDRPEDRKPWMREVSARMMQVEREVFLAGNQKAFLLPPDGCSLCTDCPDTRSECRHLQQSRPTPEAMAVDVFTTVRRFGYPIQVLTRYDQAMNRYGILLVD